MGKHHLTSTPLAVPADATGTRGTGSTTMDTINRTPRIRFASALLWAAGVVTPISTTQAAQAAGEEARNAATVRQAFDAWAAGTGGPYALLLDDAHWTIVGRSAAAGAYPDREAFMREVIRPFNARMREPLKPAIRHLYTSGDVVIVLFDARGIATDGIPYENTYTWYLTLREGRIIEGLAFFDSIAFDELWRRVPPAP